jgi:hypothetical protein
LSRVGLHWEALDEDISIAGLWPDAEISRDQRSTRHSPLGRHAKLVGRISAA